MRLTRTLTFLGMTLLTGLAYALIAGGSQIAAGNYNMTGSYQGQSFSGTLTIDADGNGTSTVTDPEHWGTDDWEYNSETGVYTIHDDNGQGPWYMEFTPNGSGGYNGKYVPTANGRQVPGPGPRPGVKKPLNWMKLN